GRVFFMSYSADAVFGAQTSNNVIFTMNGGEIGRFTTAGNLGIGTTNISHRLEVNGDANFSGTVTGGNIHAKYQDVAEWVPASEELSPGTVVVLDDTRPNHVTASTREYDTGVAGVVSATPGITLGEGGKSKVMVATTGRIHVHAD